jgi:hypothetical protein
VSEAAEIYRSCCWLHGRPLRQLYTQFDTRWYTDRLCQLGRAWGLDETQPARPTCTNRVTSCTRGITGRLCISAHARTDGGCGGGGSSTVCARAFPACGRRLVCQRSAVPEGVWPLGFSQEQAACHGGHDVTGQSVCPCVRYQRQAWVSGCSCWQCMAGAGTTS